MAAGADADVDSPAGTVLAVGVTAAAAERLAACGPFVVVEATPDAPVEVPAGTDAVVVSTRLPRGELSALVTAFVDAGPAVVALVHTGGEKTAAEVVRCGGVAAVAEGNEAAVAALLAGHPHDSGVVEVYDRQAGGGAVRRPAVGGRDTTTDLPDRTAFDLRLADFSDAPTPRIGFVRLLHLPVDDESISADAATLLRRRLAGPLRHVARHADVELFALGPADFAVVGGALTADDAEGLWVALSRVVGAFAPAGVPLAAAMGHAGGEVGDDPAVLRELALRALGLAAADRGGAVVAADGASLGGSATAELQTATRLVALVERDGRFPPGHGDRVGRFAAEIAREMGFEGVARSRIRLAAQLHHVGLAGLDPAGAGDPRAAHPLRGSRYLGVSAGAEVAAAVRAQHERWDGRGVPDGLRGRDIPLTARILAVAHAYEELTQGGDAPPGVGSGQAAAGLEELAGTVLDPDVVRAAVEALTVVAAAG